MTSRERWARIERILDELLERPPEERSSALRALAGEDAELRDDVQALLAAGADEGVLDRSLESLASPVLATDEDPAGAHPGLRIGPYRVLERLGRGGMGEVYLAERADGEFEQRVALKIIRAGRGGDAVHLRFRHERQILARLRHPNIASLYDGGSTADGAPYFVMEYVEGRPITEYADARRLDVDARLALFDAVCAGVSHAHRNLVIHRDLKPGNVLVTHDGTVKLLDFGVSKILAPETWTAEDESEAAGSGPPSSPDSFSSSPDPASSRAHAATRGFLTPAYASPEQVRGRPTTTATDVYSLGALLFELLAGCPPRGDGARASDVAAPAAEEDPPTPSATVNAADPRGEGIARARDTTPRRLARRLRGDLDAIVRKAMHTDPEDRYASVHELRADVSRHRRGLAVLARSATLGYRARRFAARNVVPVATGVVLLVSLAAFAVSMSVLYRRSQRNLARATEAEAIAQAEAEAADEVSEFMMTLFRVSNPEHAEAAPLTAREVLDRAVERVDTELADQPLVRSRLLGTLGDTYAGLGLYAESRRLHEAGLRLKRETPGESDHNLAVALNNYASMLGAAGDPRAALEAHREALAIRERAFAPDAPEVAQSLTNIGLGLRAIGELDSSRAAFERALAIKTAAYGPDHAELGSTVFNLGGLHLHLREPETALTYLRDAHRIFSREYGPDHLRTIQVLAAEAGALNQAGDLAGAREIQARVVQRLEATLGPDHPEVGVAVRNLSMLEAAAGDTTRALTLAERALGIYRVAYGDRHERVAQALTAISELTLARGGVDRARELSERGLAILDSLGLENRTTIWQLDVLGQIERAGGHEPAAVACFTRALAIAERVFGPTHGITAEVRARLAIEPGGD